MKHTVAEIEVTIEVRRKSRHSDCSAPYRSHDRNLHSNVTIKIIGLPEDTQDNSLEDLAL